MCDAQFLLQLIKDGRKQENDGAKSDNANKK